MGEGNPFSRFLRVIRLLVFSSWACLSKPVSKNLLLNQRGLPLVVACVGNADVSTELSLESSGSSRFFEIFQSGSSLTLEHDATIYNFRNNTSCIQKNLINSYWQSDEYVESMSADVDVIVMMLDFSSSLGDVEVFVRDCTDMVERYQALPTRPVIFITSPPPTNLQLSNKLLTNLLPKIAFRTGATFINLTDVFLDNNPVSLSGANHTKTSVESTHSSMMVSAKLVEVIAYTISNEIVRVLHHINDIYNVLHTESVFPDYEEVEDSIKTSNKTRARIAPSDVYSEVIRRQHQLLNPSIGGGSKLSTSRFRPIIACVGVRTRLFKSDMQSLVTISRLISMEADSSDLKLYSF